MVPEQQKPLSEPTDSAPSPSDASLFLPGWLLLDLLLSDQNLKESPFHLCFLSFLGHRSQAWFYICLLVIVFPQTLRENIPLAVFAHILTAALSHGKGSILTAW